MTWVGMESNVVCAAILLLGIAILREWIRIILCYNACHGLISQVPIQRVWLVPSTGPPNTHLIGVGV